MSPALRPFGFASLLYEQGSPIPLANDLKLFNFRWQSLFSFGWQLTTIQSVLKEMNVSHVELDHEKARILNTKLEGVQVELLLANECYQTEPREVYSVPVILSESEVLDEPLSASRIEKWGQDSRRLPKDLFWGIQMHEFNSSSPESFTMEWSRYKSKI